MKFIFEFSVYDFLSIPLLEDRREVLNITTNAQDKLDYLNQEIFGMSIHDRHALRLALYFVESICHADFAAL